ncbi:MAG: hypothetical protein ACKN9T_04130 [Candidatus Methylumidiphilus sp.]
MVAGPRKWLLFLVELVLMGVNAMLAGHELVLLAFGPQVQALGLTTAGQKLTKHRSEAEVNQGLPRIQQNIALVAKQLDELKEQLAKPPQTLLDKRAEAKGCWRRVDSMKAQIAQLKTLALWEEVRSIKEELAARQITCRGLDKEAKRLKDEFETPLLTDIGRFEADKSKLIQRLGKSPGWKRMG